MSTAPALSVLMPVRNGETHLRPAIDSILDQTFGDFEFMIVDDGSTDRTVDLVRGYDDPRIRLERLGWKVSVFEPGKYFETGTLLSQIRLRAGDLSIYRQANKHLLNNCNSLRPDVVWVFKGVEIMPETILDLKKLGILTANFNPDHPFIRTSVCHGFRNVPDCVPLYDIYFTYSSELAKSLGSRSIWSKYAVRSA